MKKILYYTILIVAFIIIFAIDTIVISHYNLNLFYAIPLGGVFVIYAFRLVKSVVTNLMFSNKMGVIYSNDDKKETSKKIVDDNSIIAFKTQNIVKEDERAKSPKEILYVVDKKKATLRIYILIFSYLIATLFLALSIYTLKTDYPKKHKYEEMLKEYRNESEAKFYIKTSIYKRFFENKTSTEPEDNISTRFGKFISAYQGRKSGTHVYSYYVDDYYYDSYYRRELSYSRKDYKTFRFDYTVNLSVYNINNLNYEVSDSICKHGQLCITSYLDSLNVKYSDLKGKQNGCHLSYSLSEGNDKTLKSIFLTNDNIYELTTSWIYKEKWKNRNPFNEIDNEMGNTHNEILDSIITVRMDEYISNTNLKIISSFCMFVLFFIIFYSICFKMNGILQNKGNEKKLLLFISFFSIINFFLLIVQYGSIYYARIDYNNSTLTYLYIFSASVSFMNMPMLGFISRKSCESCQFDYLLTRGIKAYLKDRTQSVAEYKSIISFATYPFFVFGNLPCGILLLPFWILFAIIQTILLELRSWIQWLYVPETTNVENCSSYKSKTNMAFIALLLFVLLIIVSFLMGWPSDIIELIGPEHKNPAQLERHWS